MSVRFTTGYQAHRESIPHLLASRARKGANTMDEMTADAAKTTPTMMIVRMGRL
jgi:hypothetical protein